MAGPLTQNPFGAQFWGALRGGLRKQVLDPMVQDVRQGHRALNEHYPLPYQAAQIASAPVGIAAAGMDFADHMQGVNPDAGTGDRQVDGALSAVSSVPVHEVGYGNVGTSLPTSVSQAATSHAIPGAGALARGMPGVFGGMYKLAAGVNAAQLGKASYDQFDPELVAKRSRTPR